MKFLDQAKIFVEAGYGGSGSASFRREKFVEYGGQLVLPGNIIVRQRGTKIHPGNHVGFGIDHSIFSLVKGKVQFKTSKLNRTFVSVITS